MELPNIIADSEEGFVHLTFAATANILRADGTRLVSARGEYEGREVGFAVVLLGNWELRQFGDLGSLFQGVVGIGAEHPESDDLLTIIDNLYHAEEGPSAMAEFTTFTAIALEGDPRSLETLPVKLKLFFEADFDEAYAEVYLNIDPAAHRLELREKDPDYRQALVRALSSRAEAA